MTQALQPLVIIIAGSKSDEAHYQKIAAASEQFGVETIVRIGSAHKTADHVLKFLTEYENNPRPKVYITVAGRSNALGGFVDGIVTAPVITCPPASDSFAGADVFSSLRMPSGISPAVVLEPQNAALLAARILALNNPTLHEKIQAWRAKQAQQILTDDAQLQSKR